MALKCQDAFQSGKCYYWPKVSSFKALAKSAMEKPRSNPRALDKDVRNALAPFNPTPFNLAWLEQSTVPLKVSSFKQCFETVSFFSPLGNTHENSLLCGSDSRNETALQWTNLWLFVFLSYVLLRDGTNESRHNVQCAWNIRQTSLFFHV